MSPFYAYGWNNFKNLPALQQTYFLRFPLNLKHLHEFNHMYFNVNLYFEEIHHP